MYRATVKRIALRHFAELSKGNYELLLAGVTPDVHHVSPGDNALGGERHSRESMRRWFERLQRLFPTLRFEIRGVSVSGWPWNTMVAVEWTNRGEATDGEPYVNEGTHVMRLRWGKADYVHAYLDSEKVTRTCDRLAAAGLEEAAASPITD